MLLHSKKAIEEKLIYTWKLGVEVEGHWGENPWWRVECRTAKGSRGSRETGRYMGMKWGNKVFRIKRDRFMYKLYWNFIQIYYLYFFIFYLITLFGCPILQKRLCSSLTISSGAQGSVQEVPCWWDMILLKLCTEVKEITREMAKDNPPAHRAFGTRKLQGAIGQNPPAPKSLWDRQLPVVWHRTGVHSILKHANKKTNPELSSCLWNHSGS